VTVYLVGAGPGDPGLLTARALELIAGADVIIHDRLIPATALDGARADAQLLYAGKEGGGPSASQQEIEMLLLEHGAAGREVVRLKGGDPFVFGRGGEEAERLRGAGIPFEIVPGVTAGVAASAYAGIPVTHRDAASAVAFVTGHEDPAKFGVGGTESALDWVALARFPGTLVVYMGVRRLEAIAGELMAGGRSGDEPAAVIQRGTLPDQRVVSGTLQTIAGAAAAAGVRAPAISVFGPVAALRSELAWFESRPLGGRTVAVTRARAQASGLASRLRDLGAAVIEAPAIRIQEIAGPAPDLARYDLVCLTSPNGVRLLLERLYRAGQDARAFGGARDGGGAGDASPMRIAAIGPGTAAALREHGLIADVVPESFVAEGLVQALADVPVRRALVARAAQARDVLPDALRRRGVEVDVLDLYETVAEPMSERQRETVAGADYVTFTSSSTVRFFFASLDGAVPERARLVSIGPVTSETLREHGREPDVEATRHDIDGLVGALVQDVTGSAPS
jgi:uroporphyrinogen III methyltransferase/synthase